MFVDRREIITPATSVTVWAAVSALGVECGYYAANWLWRLRGIMDRLIGGPGLRRGRRRSGELRLGDALDFWRVTLIDPPRRLELTAQMKLPGVATLSFDIDPAPSPGTGTRPVMTVRFCPRGLLGIAYWYSVLLLHGIVFRGMLNGLAHAAEGTAPRPE